MGILARALTRHAVIVLLATLALTVFAISRIVDLRTGQVHLVLCGITYAPGAFRLATLGPEVRLADHSSDSRASDWVLATYSRLTDRMLACGPALRGWTRGWRA